MTSGSLLRGHLRPSGARGPPFLVIGLVLVVVILGVNYWNLNGEYQAITKEIDELQDNLHMAVLKKENAERQYEVYEKRFHETEAKLGKEKIAAEQKDRLIAQATDKFNAKVEEAKKLNEQLNFCQQSNGKLETSSKQLEGLQMKFKSVQVERDELARENEKMITVIRDLKIKLEELTFQQARLGMAHTGSNPILTRGVPSNGATIQDNATDKLSSNQIKLPRNDNVPTQQPLSINETNHEETIGQSLDETALTEENKGELDKLKTMEKMENNILEDGKGVKADMPVIENNNNINQLPNKDSLNEERNNTNAKAPLESPKRDGLGFGGLLDNQQEKLEVLNNPNEVKQENALDQSPEIQAQAQEGQDLNLNQTKENGPQEYESLNQQADQQNDVYVNKMENSVLFQPQNRTNEISNSAIFKPEQGPNILPNDVSNNNEQQPSNR